MTFSSVIGDALSIINGLEEQIFTFQTTYLQLPLCPRELALLNYSLASSFIIIFNPLFACTRLHCFRKGSNYPRRTTNKTKLSSDPSRLQIKQ